MMKRILAAAALAIVVATPLVAQPSPAPHRSVRIAERTDAGDWDGTWWYVSRDAKMALWIRTVDGVPELRFQYASKNAPEGFVTDWNDDGLLDIICDCSGWHPDCGSMFFLRNVGSRSNPVFAQPERILCFGKPIFITRHGPHPWVGDMDGDGRPDILTCVEWSVYPFYSHNALKMDHRPTFVLETSVLDRDEEAQ